jgi:hypothetical protein
LPTPAVLEQTMFTTNNHDLYLKPSKFYWNIDCILYNPGLFAYHITGIFIKAFMAQRIFIRHINYNSKIKMI